MCFRTPSLFSLFFGYLYQSNIFILHVQILHIYIYSLFHWTTLFFLLFFYQRTHRSMTTTPGTPSQRDLDQKARQLQAWEENIQRQQEELMEAR